MSPLRRRYGLRWKKDYLTSGDIDRNVLRVLWGILILLVLLLALSELIRNADAAYRIVRVERDLRIVETTLIDCLNGKAVWKGGDGIEVGCLKAETN